MIAPLLVFAALQVMTYTEVGNDELRSTVTLAGPCNATCAPGRETIGSGEIIGRRFNGDLVVVTARHVVENSRWLAAFTQNGTAPGMDFSDFARFSGGRRTNLIAYASNVDLAIVTFSPRQTDDFAIASLADVSPPATGVVVGAPNGALWIASHYSLIANGPTTFDVACDTCGPGDSGGGVFDPGGRLIGLVVEQAVGDARERLSVFAAISLRELRVFLDDAATQRALARVPVGEADVWKRFDTMRFANAYGAAAATKGSGS